MEDPNFVDPFGFLKPSFNVGEGSPGTLCEVKTYEARYNLRGERIPLAVGKKRDLEPQRHDDHDSALVLTRFYTRLMELDRTELTIRSPFMKQALKNVIKEYPGVSFDTETIVIYNQPKLLFHYRYELHAYALSFHPSTPEFDHVLLLLQYMFGRLGSQVSSYNNLMDSPGLLPGLEFLNLWMAFRPGDHLWMKYRDTFRVVKLKSMQRCECLERNCDESRWKLTYEYIANDGRKVGYVEGASIILPYDGYRALQKLKIFPLSYHPASENIKFKAVERGRKMMQLRGVHYLKYDGESASHGEHRNTTLFGESDVFPLQSCAVKSRIVVDAENFGRINPSNKLDIDDSADPLPMIDGTLGEYALTEDHLLICDYEVPGFSLADKRWCWFELEKIGDIEFNVDAFEKLLLPPEQKVMIRSLVEVHTNSALSFDDVIKGKGRGMVFLLHGVPGVGKTLTAESVADITQRPLYTISCGELGVHPKEVEANLQAAMKLATTWNAIVLIDEADVFLEQRGTNDLERNSLVSIFLRLLEYYEGILFLTTNRIASFDTAFKSRIHLAIKYHQLSVEYRANLWKSFILNTRNGLRPEWLTDEYLERIGTENLNGRQIKNSVRTAYALAVRGDGMLMPFHIELALNAMKMFESDFANTETEEVTREVPERGMKRRREGH